MQCIRGPQLVLLTVAVSLGIFMNVLDTSIANVSIPTIAGNMGVSASQGTWVITSFTVSTAIVLPLTGWLAKRFGEVRLFVTATFLFTVASFLCGISTSLPMLVFFRVIQGAVAGPMIPLSQSLLLANYPPEKKGLATGLWAMVAVAAPVLGPLLGGYITDMYSWPWIFFINIPIGLFSVYFTWTILKNRETEKAKLPVDFVGIILLAIGVGCLQVLLDQGKDLDWFNSFEIRLLAITSVISLCFFVLWELTERYPIVDLTLFKGRNFTVGTITVSLGYMAFFGTIVILPLWLQTEMDYTPTWAGLVTAPLGILPLILSPVIARLMDKIDLRLIVSIGFFAFAGCAFWIAILNTQVAHDKIALIRFIQGFGVPCFFIPTISIILSGLPDKCIASAAGLYNFLRIVAGSFGTSISVALWTNRETVHQSKLVENLTTYNANMQSFLNILHSYGLSTTASYAETLKIVTNQAFMLATADVFWLSGILFFILMFFVWLARPPFVTKGTAVIAE